MRTYPFIYTEGVYEIWLIYFNQWAKDERFLENIIFVHISYFHFATHNIFPILGLI